MKRTIFILLILVSVVMSITYGGPSHLVGEDARVLDQFRGPTQMLFGGDYFCSANYIGNGYWLSVNHCATSERFSIGGGNADLVSRGSGFLDDWAIFKRNEVRESPDPLSIDYDHEYRRGEKVKRVGYDRGSKTIQSCTYKGQDQGMIKFKCPVHGGASGGGIFNEDGELIAVISLATRPARYMWAVDLDDRLKDKLDRE